MSKNNMNNQKEESKQLKVRNDFEEFLSLN